MYQDVVEIRILPNNKSTFPTEQDFHFFIENTFRERGGYYYFPNLMMQCEGKTLVLFQYDGMIRAVGVLLDAVRESVRDERGIEYAGYYRFDMSTVCYLSHPVDTDTLKEVYPDFIAFSQSKQRIPMEHLDSILALLFDDEDAVQAVEDELEQLQLQGATKEALVKVRVNQGLFREKLLRRYVKCCLCGVSDPRMLIASHIKPWAAAEPSEKLDVDNGFLFCPNHDRLFDQGLISFSDDGKICISEELSEIDKIFMNVQATSEVKLTEKNRQYLSYHRAFIFKH